MAAPDSRPHTARAARTAHRERAAARRVAVPPARVVAALSLPSPSCPRLSAVAHAYRIRRLRRGSAGGGRDPLRAVGGERTMIDALTAPSVTTPDAAELARLTKAHAYAVGFDLVGITALGPAETSREFEAWLAEGRGGTMAYLERGAEKRRDTRLPLPGTTHAVVVALDYGGREPSGPVARYARGDDYHDVMDARLRDLHRRVNERVGRSVPGKPYVDTGPLLERDLARRAGLGWFGKNTMLINPRLGSFFFLGALLLDLDLVTDAPFEAERCGTCTRCLDACPTQALVEPGVLDARRCISYLSIELRGEIPVDLRSSVGGLLYGCDICQEVCPYNVKFAQELK